MKILFFSSPNFFLWQTEKVPHHVAGWLFVPEVIAVINQYSSLFWEGEIAELTNPDENEIQLCYNKHKNKTRFYILISANNSHISAIFVDSLKRHYYLANTHDSKKKREVAMICKVFGRLEKALGPRRFQLFSKKTDGRRTCGHHVCDYILGVLYSIAQKVSF